MSDVSQYAHAVKSFEEAYKAMERHSSTCVYCDFESVLGDSEEFEKNIGTMEAYAHELLSVTSAWKSLKTAWNNLSADVRNVVVEPTKIFDKCAGNED